MDTFRNQEPYENLNSLTFQKIISLNSNNFNEMKTNVWNILTIWNISLILRICELSIGQWYEGDILFYIIYLEFSNVCFICIHKILIINA